MPVRLTLKDIDLGTDAGFQLTLADLKDSLEPIEPDKEYHWAGALKRIVPDTGSALGGAMPHGIGYLGGKLAEYSAGLEELPRKPSYQPEGFPGTRPPIAEGAPISPAIPAELGKDKARAADLWKKIRTVGEENKAYYRKKMEEDPDIRAFMASTARGTESLWTEALGSLGPTIAGVFVAPIPVLGPVMNAAMFFDLNKEEIYDATRQRLIQEGLDEQEAHVRAEKVSNTGGAVNALLDVFGADFIAGAATRPVRRRLLKFLMGVAASSAVEGGTEGAQGVIAKISEEWAARPRTETRDQFADRMVEMAPELAKIFAHDAAVGAMIGGGMTAALGGLGAGMEAREEKKRPRLADIVPMPMAGTGVKDLAMQAPPDRKGKPPVPAMADAGAEIKDIGAPPESQPRVPQAEAERLRQIGQAAAAELDQAGQAPEVPGLTEAERMGVTPEEQAGTYLDEILGREPYAEKPPGEEPYDEGPAPVEPEGPGPIAPDQGPMPEGPAPEVEGTPAGPAEVVETLVEPSAAAPAEEAAGEGAGGAVAQPEAGAVDPRAELESVLTNGQALTVPGQQWLMEEKLAKVIKGKMDLTAEGLRRLKELRKAGKGRDLAVETLTGLRPGKEEEKGKEPWEMTAEEYSRGAKVRRDLERNYVIITAPNGAEIITRTLDPGQPDQRLIRGAHRSEIAEAIREGKPVPASVLDDYPDLSKPEKAAKEPWEMTRAEFLKPVKAAAYKDIETGRIIEGTQSDVHFQIAEKEGIQTKDIEKRYIPGFISHEGDFLTRDQASKLVKRPDRKTQLTVHKELVGQAISEGKPVPASVLADYPDLAPKAPVDTRLTEKKEQLEKKLERLNTEVARRDETDMPGTYVTGASGVPGSRIRKLDRQLDKRIDLATKIIETKNELTSLNAKIAEQENAPKTQAVKEGVRSRLQEQFDSIEVGDKVDVGGNEPLTVIKKNKRTVVTEGGSKWSADEIAKVVKATGKEPVAEPAVAKESAELSKSDKETSQFYKKVLNNRSNLSELKKLGIESQEEADSVLARVKNGATKGDALYAIKDMREPPDDGKPTAIGTAWVKNQWKPITDSREITKGKNKGKFRVTLADGKKRTVETVRMGEAPEPLTREQKLSKIQQEAEAKNRERANKAKSFRMWVKYAGGIQRKDKTWAGEIRDIIGRKGMRGMPPGLFKRTALGIDEMTLKAIEAGWLPKGATEEDFIRALEENPREKLSEVGTEEWVDKQYEEEYNKYIEGLRDEGYSEADIRRADRAGTPEEIERAEAEIQRLEREGKDGKYDQAAIDELDIWFTKEQQSLFGKPEQKSFELTPEELTEKEKLARAQDEAKRKGIQKKGQRSVFQHGEGIKPGITGKQQDLFTPTEDQKQTDLFTEKSFTEGTKTPNNEQPAYDARPEEQPKITLKGPIRLPGAPRMQYRSTGRIKAAKRDIQNLQDLASLLASLRKRSSETFYSVAVDKNGRILEVNEHSAGGPSSTYVLPGVLVGRALRIPGVAKVYYAHNHPSITIKESPQDVQMTAELNALMQMAGLETQSIILGGDSFVELNEFGTFDVEKIKPVLRKEYVPRVARRFGRAYRPKQAQITDAEVAKEFFKENFPDDSGVLLVDRKNRPLAFIPFVKGRTMRQMTRDILAMAEDTNAGAMVAKNDTDNERIRIYIDALMRTGIGQMTALDSIEKGLSFRNSEVPYRQPLLPDMAQGLLGSPVERFSLRNAYRQAQIPDTFKPVSPDRLNRLAQRIAKTWKNAPPITVVEKQADLPDTLLMQQEGKVISGAYHNGQVYLVAENMLSPTFARKTVAHEVIGHHGFKVLREVPEMQARMDRFLDRLYRTQKEAIDRIGERYGYDTGTKDGTLLASEEWLARTAETNPRDTWVRRAVALIRQWLAKVFPGLKVANSEIAAWVGQMRKAVEGGEVPGVGINQFAQDAKFSLDKAAAKIKGMANFKKWFGDSKVVDENGEPLVVYHSGSFRADEDGQFVIEGPEEGIHFGTEDAARARIGGKAVDEALQEIEVYQNDDGTWGYEIEGIDYSGEFETEDEAYQDAEEMAMSTEVDDYAYEDGNLTEVYLSIQNPKRVGDQGANWSVAIGKAKMEGYDGVVYTNQFEDKGSTSYIAFHPTQIKSIYNTGTWDATNPDIRLQTVFHGTPHVWMPEPGFPHGRPRLDKIGTGEGAQAYGWGWYSAESEGVGEAYKKGISTAPPIRTFKGKQIEPGTPEYHAASLLDGTDRTLSNTKKEVLQWIENAKEGEDIEHYRTVLKTLNSAERKGDFGYKPNPGSLYTLDIPDDVGPKLLDWDAPLSEQSEYVKKALKGTDVWKSAENVTDGAGRSGLETYTGEDLYNILANKEESTWRDRRDDKAASEFLARAGIPGNKYLDEGSRYPLTINKTGDMYHVYDGPRPALTHGFAMKSEAEKYIKEHPKPATYNYVIWSQPVLDRIALLERNGEKLDAIREAEHGAQQGAGSQRFSIESVLPWPRGFPKAYAHTTVGKVTHHSDFKAAKGGDVDAAMRMVTDLVKPERLKALAEQYPDAIVVPVHEIEAGGVNMIPLAMARILEKEGLKVADDIFQKSTAERKGLNAVERLTTRKMFDGPVEKGGQYILADDVLTQGGTMHELRHYIANNGGEAVAVFSLAFSAGSNIVSIKDETVSAVDRRFGRENIESFLQKHNISGTIEALTESEGKALLRFKTFDALRRRLSEKDLRGGLEEAPEGILSAQPSARTRKEGIVVSSDRIYEGLPPEVRERLETSGKGLGRETWLDRVRRGVVNVARLRRHFESLGRDLGHISDPLRVLEGSQHRARQKAGRTLTDIVTGLEIPENKRVFELSIVMDDMIRDLDAGLLLEPEAEGETLPFGFNNRIQVEAYRKHLDQLIADDPRIQKALDQRKAYMTRLKQDLVGADLLKPETLEDDAYFHHQVLLFRALENLDQEYRFKDKAREKDVRLHRKGWQRARKGSLLDYSTEYVESEFEVISQALHQLDVKAAMDVIRERADIFPSLKQAAKQWNHEEIYRRAPNPLEDPLMPFRQRVAINTGELFKMVGGDEPSGLYEAAGPGFQDVVEDMAEAYREYLDELAEWKEAGGKESGQPRPYPSIDHPKWFPFLAHLLSNPGAGRKQAAGIFKAILDRNNFIETTLGKDFKTWRDMVPDGYAAWDPKPDGVWFSVNAVSDQMLEQMRSGEKPIPEKIAHVFARVPSKKWVVPKEVAHTMDHFQAPPAGDVISRGLRAAQGGWKQWILLNPFRVVKYNLNNMSGDLDIAMAYAPKIITHYLPRAVKDLAAKTPSRPVAAELAEAKDRDVLGSGWTLQEAHDVTRYLEKEGMLNILLNKENLAQKYWKNIKRFTVFRENLLRLAAYRYFKDQIRAGRVPGKDLIGASSRKEIQALQKSGGTADEMAAKLSRELIGDYGNVSRGGQWLRSYVLPFWSWMEINTPRYARLMWNLPHEGKSPARGLAAMGVQLGWRGAMLGVKASMLYGAIMLWNRLMWPDEDDEMKETQRKDLHIILGRREDGSIISLRFEGALADALEWLNLQDAVKDLDDMAEGKKTWGDQVAEMIKSPFQRMLLASRPDVKGAAELIMGRSLFPDPEFPRPIRDKWQHIASIFSLQKPYEWAAGKPKRGRDTTQRLWNDVLSMGFYSADPGEMAYWNARKAVIDWQKKNRQEPAAVIPTDTANALYYYKQALRYGDLKAADTYLTRYAELGGSLQGMEASVRAARPMHGIAAKDRQAFLTSLTADERKSLERAQTWYETVYTDISKGLPEIVSRLTRAEQSEFLKPPIVSPPGKNEAVVQEINRLILSRDLGMGPPARKVTVGGIPVSMTDVQYETYLERSSEMSMARLGKMMAAPSWARLPDARKADRIRRIIEAARKRARKRVKWTLARPMSHAEEQRRAING